MAEKEIKRVDLAKYNGQNGNPAYVAVNGKVYDVTDSPAWTGGEHHGNPGRNRCNRCIIKQVTTWRKGIG